MTIQWNRRKYTKEEFIRAWKESLSIAECGRKLGLAKSAGIYKLLRSTAEELNLTDDHMLGQGWNKGGVIFDLRAYNRKPIEDYLVKGRRVESGHLKSRLLSDGILEYKCYAPLCPITFEPLNPFTGVKSELKLTLDHINGDNTDNRRENLRFLCHYCHPYTPTFSRAKRKKDDGPLKTRCSCGAKKNYKALRCRKCYFEYKKNLQM